MLKMRLSVIPLLEKLPLPFEHASCNTKPHFEHNAISPPGRTTDIESFAPFGCLQALELSQADLCLAYPLQFCAVYQVSLIR
jgi:hypothetical protein